MPAMQPSEFGGYLKSLRNAAGLTLRQVEAKTDGRVKNAYLSQIEHGGITRVSAEILWELAAVYGISWPHLLARGGHRVPEDAVGSAPLAIAGLPLRAFEDLDDDDRGALVDFVAFLKQRKTR
jgi:HTH-type transcriptional regulator, competence development regulator